MKLTKADDKVTAPQGAQVALPIGSLVRYYDEGWRAGYLDEIKGKVAYIRPIVFRLAAKPNRVKIPLGDVETCE